MNHTRQITEENIEHVRQLLETFQPDTIELGFTTLANAHAFLNQYGHIPTQVEAYRIIIGAQPYQVNYTLQPRFLYEEGPPAVLRENRNLKALTVRLTKINC